MLIKKTAHFIHGRNPKPNLTLESIPATMFVCGECASSFGNVNDLNTHTLNHNQPPCFKCEDCPFISNNKNDVDTHKQVSHMSVKVDVKQVDQVVIRCEQCDYKCKFTIQLKKHMKATHPDPAMYSCNQCDYSTEFIANAWEHTLYNHKDEPNKLDVKESENFILKMVAEQTHMLTGLISSLKTDTKNALNEITKTLDNMKNENDDKCKSLGNSVVKIVNKISKMEKLLVLNTLNRNKRSMLTSKTEPVEEENKAGKIKANKAVKSKVKTNKMENKNPPVSPPQPKAENVVKKSAQEKKTAFLNKPKVLYIGDSIGHTANLRLVEKASNCRVVSASA